MKNVGEKIFTESEFETCVLCGKTTEVLRAEPVQNRADYVEGCGQLCPDCAQKIRNEQNESVRKRHG